MVSGDYPELRLDFLEELRGSVPTTSDYLRLRKPSAHHIQAREFAPGAHLGARLMLVGGGPRVRPEAYAVLGGPGFGGDPRVVAKEAVGSREISDLGYRAVPKDSRWNVEKRGSAFDLQRREEWDGAIEWLVQTLVELDGDVRPQIEEILDQ